MTVRKPGRFFVRSGQPIELKQPGDGYKIDTNPMYPARGLYRFIFVVVLVVVVLEYIDMASDDP